MSTDSTPVPKMRCGFNKPTSVYITPIHNMTPGRTVQDPKLFRIQLYISALPVESPADLTCSWLLLTYSGSTDAWWHFGWNSNGLPAADAAEITVPSNPLWRSLVKSLYGSFNQHWLNTAKVMAPDPSSQVPTSASSFTPL